MQTPDKDRLDLWLEHALRQQGDVEPRPGFESRLLASLSAQRRNRTRAAWAWTLSGAAVAVLFLVIFLRPGVERHESPANNESVANVAHTISRQAQPKVLTAEALSAPSEYHQPHNMTHAARVASGDPRLTHFPSVRPLDPQELALARYAVNYPAEAELVAKEQENFDAETQKAEQAAETGAVLEDQNQ